MTTRFSFAITFLVIVVLSSTGLADNRKDKTGAKSTPSTTRISVESGDAKFVYAEASKSVVIIEANSSSGKRQGSGVVFKYGSKTQGKPSLSWIVTNAHVVKGQSNVTVIQTTNKYLAVVEYVDEDFDIAILRMDGVVLPMAKPNQGSQLAVGSKVFAIGSPMGLENSITEGILSGIRKHQDTILLQTTAPISPGNSGGGLFDTEARLIGVTTFKLKGGEGLNFAVDAAHITGISEAALAAEILRIFAKDLLTGDEIALTQSDRLTKWLLTQRGQSGNKLYVDVQRRVTELAQAQENEQIAEQLQWYQQILKRFIDDQKVQGKTRASVEAETVQLICTVADKNGGNRHDIVVVLDYQAKTVNRNPAIFTDAEIRWTSGDKYNAILNRYSSSIILGTERFPILLSGKCSLPTKQKF